MLIYDDGDGDDYVNEHKGDGGDGQYKELYNHDDDDGHWDDEFMMILMLITYTRIMSDLPCTSV